MENPYCSCKLTRPAGREPPFHCLSLASHCLSLAFHCLSLAFHCLSLDFHCLSLDFHWGSPAFRCLSLTFLGLSLTFLGLSLSFLDVARAYRYLAAHREEFQAREANKHTLSANYFSSLLYGQSRHYRDDQPCPLHLHVVSSVARGRDSQPMTSESRMGSTGRKDSSTARKGRPSCSKTVPFFSITLQSRETEKHKLAEDATGYKIPVSTIQVTPTRRSRAVSVRCYANGLLHPGRGQLVKHSRQADYRSHRILPAAAVAWPSLSCADMDCPDLQANVHFRDDQPCPLRRHIVSSVICIARVCRPTWRGRPQRLGRP